MQVRTFDTSYKTNEMCEGETPHWSEHDNKHHFILIDGIIVGYVFDDEDVFELFVGVNPNYTIEQIAKDPAEVVNACGMSEWDEDLKRFVQIPNLFDFKDEKFIGEFDTLENALENFIQNNK